MCGSSAWVVLSLSTRDMFKTFILLVVGWFLTLFFSSPVPSNVRASHSGDSLFWQEFHTPDGPRITWLQTSPFKGVEPCLRNQIKVLENNLPQLSHPHLHVCVPTAPSEPLSLSQSVLVFGQRSTVTYLAPWDWVFSQLRVSALGAAC